MKKSNKKQLLRLSIVTAAIVFVVCVITIAAYAIITYDYTKDTLTNNEENEAAEFFNDIYDEISLHNMRCVLILYCCNGCGLHIVRLSFSFRRQLPIRRTLDA